MVSSPEAEDIIDEALHKFEPILRELDVTIFKQTHLEAVYEAARSIERDQEHRKRLRNLRRIEPLLEGLRLLGKAIDGVCHGAYCVNYTWAPVKYLLQIAAEHDESFKELVTAYSQIAKHLPRSAKLSTSCQEHGEIQVAVAAIYSDILEFHGHVYLFLNRGSWKQLFDASWKSFRGHFDNILARLKQGRDLVDGNFGYCNHQIQNPQQPSQAGPSETRLSRSPISLEDTSVKHYGSSHINGGAALLGDNHGTIHVHQHCDFTKASSCRRQMTANLEKDERERRDHQFRETIGWLELDGQDREQENKFLQRAEAREATTCEWIKHHPPFRSWLERKDERPFLWLRGKPGSGKTTLATFVEREVNVDQNALLLYCLCSPDLDQDGGDPCSLILRILITQILHKKPILVSFIYEEYFMKARQPARYVPYILRTLLNSLDLSYIIVDGVDEWRNESQTRLFRVLDAILARKKDEDPERPELKILLCSQDTKATMTRMRKEPTISLSDEHEHVSRDIRIYTRTSLASLYERFEKQDVDDIATEVVRKANGMFLWVRLVVDTLLEQQSIYDLQTTVQNLPSELTGVYVHILKRLEAHRDDRQKARIRGIFVWITLARRPLKTWEICDALVLGTASQGLTKQTILHKEILDLCKPLIEEHRDNTVMFIHFSVQRFLLSPEASGPYLQLEAARREVGATCCRYLMNCGAFFSNVKTLGTYKQIALGLHSLFPYIKDHGRTHMIDCELVDEREPRRDDFEIHVRTFLHQSLNCGPAQLSIPTDESDIDEFASPGELCQQGPVWRISLPITQYLTSISKEEVSHDRSSETSGTLMEQDLSPIEKAYACYQEQFETLLQGDRDCPTIGQMDITQHDMEKFCSRYATVPYLCRWPRCPRSTQGFSAPTERAKHEHSHMQRFRCPKPTCEFAEVGLTSQAALRRHVRRYHEQEQDVAIPRLALSKHRVKTLDRGTSRLGGTQSSEGEPESVRSSDADVMSSSTRSFPGQQHPHPMPSLEENPDRDVSGPLVVTSDPALSPVSGFNFDFSTLENSDVLENFDFDSFLLPLPSEELNDFLKNNSGSSASALSQLVKKYSALEHSDLQEDREAFAKLRALCEQTKWRESVLLLLNQGNGGSLSEVQRLLSLMDKAIQLKIPRTDTSFHALHDRARVKLQRVPTAIPTSSNSLAQTILVTPPTPGLLDSNDVEKHVDISSDVQTPVDRSVKVYELRDDDWYDHGTGTYRGTYVKSDGTNDHYYLLVAPKSPEQEQLLSTPILEEGNYQKQGDACIVWTEADGREMSLSFLEAVVCTEAWDYIRQARLKMFFFRPDQDPAPTVSRPFLGTDATAKPYVDFCQSYGGTIEAAIKAQPHVWPDRPLTELLRLAWHGQHLEVFAVHPGVPSHALLMMVKTAQQQPMRHRHRGLQHPSGYVLSATEQLHARYVFDAMLGPGLEGFSNHSERLEQAWKGSTPAELRCYLDTAIPNGIKPMDSYQANLFILEKYNEARLARPLKA